MERVLSRLADVAHGVVTRGELLAAGLSCDEIDYRIEIGILIAVHPGVYRVGHCAPSVEATYLAAVKACGEGALLAGRAAAHLHGLLTGPAPDPEVICPTERRVAGVRSRRARAGIDPRDADTHRAIPVTSVPRTLVDVAAVLGQGALARACHEAGVRHDTTPQQVGAVLGRRPNSKGARKLRRILHGDVHVTLSALERRFLGRLRRAGMPLPVTNRPAGARRVDCRWPGHRLTVELDGYRFHRSRHAWELDRRRERIARARGDEFRRYTFGDVCEHPTLMMAELHALLRVPS